MKNFAQISAPLIALTHKDNKWKAGPLPADALKAFKEMQTILVSEPVMAYPRRNCPYALITNASLGDSDQKKPGGLGAILTQIDKNGEHQVIPYASWRCKLPFGLWSTLILTFADNTSRCLWITDLRKS